MTPGYTEFESTQPDSFDVIERLRARIAELEQYLYDLNIAHIRMEKERDQALADVEALTPIFRHTSGEE